MSFNTSTSGGDNGNDGGGGESLYSKKLKRQKIPKRGPGVAELEKILRDQERKDDHLGGGSSLISSSSKNAVPFSVDHDQFIIPSYGENVSSLSLGINNHLGEGNGGAHARRSGIFLPQNVSSPAMWSSHEINSTDFIGTDNEGTNFTYGFAFPTRTTDGSSSIIPSPVIPQKQMQYISAMKYPFGHSGLASSLPPAVAGANYHHIEPPSNQISCCPYSNAWPEQEKMVHTKRSWPFSTNNLVNSPLLYQVSSYLPHKHQIEQSTSCGNERAFNLEPCVEFSREIKSKSSVPTQRRLTDYNYRTPEGKSFMFGSPAIQPANEGSGQGVIKFVSLPFQGTMESCQRSMERQQSSEAGQAGLVHKKPFYSFFELGEEMNRVDTSIRLNTERVEERGDGVDLNLRL